MITNTRFPRKFGKNEIISVERKVLLSLQDEISSECIRDFLVDSYFPLKRKAFLYNIYNDRAASWSGACHISEHLNFAIKHSIFQKKWQIGQYFSSLSDAEETFLRKTRRNFRENALPTQILQAIKRDSASELEIVRVLNNKKISLGIMYAILTYNAKSTINFLLKKYSDEIFSLRTPQEWLFTLCNYFYLSAAIDFIKHIEEKFPGIVKNTIDPWGNDLLWHTFYNDNVWNPHYKRMVNSIQQCLIDLGCDPNKRNELDLSFNSVLENTP